MKQLDCLGLQMIAEDFIDSMHMMYDGGYSLTIDKAYLLLWYLFNENIDIKLLQAIPIAVVIEAKNFIIRRKLYAKDSKRPADIEAHCEAICRYLQLNKPVDPARFHRRDQQLCGKKHGEDSEGDGNSTEYSLKGFRTETEFLH